MSCPVVGEVDPALNPDAKVSSFVSAGKVAQAEALLRGVDSILPTCEGPARNLRECQRKSAETGSGDCSRQAECYLGCDRMVNQRTKLVFGACGDKLEGHVPSPHARFFQCLKSESEEACLGALEAFVACGRKAIETK
ncbi:Hypothetical Protein FCC1311_064742 [Hondaea fermentalgiana]|uniref:Uncharacterized protein n=1 Tax=Hondaea fermentalgiana TaxID=2315210 RepID=A0A2R5GQU7_9STRA|nr:Hypothetical Protein FCC1311_064742 [Hondaea fermentalgiana]|eukprot:GBG30254.1 Hypothetical Protein FCC1311_064742 [Hondaea fermentalgiana]